MDSVRPTAVLDDDPTGTQAVAGVFALLDYHRDLVARHLCAPPHAVHLLTNTRALSPAEAEATTAAAVACVPAQARVIMRGDSTLRAHLVEEYRPLARARFPGSAPALVLVPALPTAGRITRGGIQWWRAPDGRLVSLERTEFARDGAFSYSSARLLDWAWERSDGLFAPADGVEVHLERLRTEGAEAVAAAIVAAAGVGRPACCALDAESFADLKLIADGVRRAERAGVPFLVRCGPAFAGVLCGTLAPRRPAIPALERPLLVVCGSYVSTTTEQLERLRVRLGPPVLEADLFALCAPDRARREITALARRLTGELERRGLAVLSTPRRRPAELSDLGSGRAIARGLAEVVAALPAECLGAVIAKGGITSQVVARDGLGARAALVEGPLLDGVVLWRLALDGRELPYVVFPGNVGGADTLAELVERFCAAGRLGGAAAA